MVAIVGIAILLGVGLLLLALCNPMLLVFLQKFEVVNQSGADLWVTPIGMCEGSGKYGPLRMYHNMFPPAIPKFCDHDIPLKSGQSLTVIYDWDDINFRHILVRTQRGEALIVDTDKMGDLHHCYRPQQDKYEIPPLAQLSKASPELLPCIEGKSVTYSGVVVY